MTQPVETERPPLEFDKLKAQFESLKPGQQAEIRRARVPDDLGFIPSAYRLLPPGQRPNKQWLQVMFFLPHAKHNLKAAPLGKQLAQAEISEMRMFQIIRSEFPNDLLYLRRILQQVEPVVNWNEFGATLFYWGDRQKRQLVEDYFLSSKP